MLMKTICIFGLIAMTIILLACPDEIQDNEAQDKAVVSFSVMGNTARTVFPQVDLEDVTLYKLFGGINGATETILHEFTGDENPVLVELNSGTWNFTLSAYNEGGELILQGKILNKQISLTETNQVSFFMSVLKSSMGTIQITLNFPGEAGITHISINGDITSETFTDITGGNFVYTKNEIAAGDYFINFELYREEMLRTTVSELVLVRDNLTSKKTITLVGENLKPIPTYEIIIDDFIKGIDEWELLLQKTEVIPNEDNAFTITGTYATYQWYLDGISVGTSSSYILNKPVGVYQLVVVVTNSAGESRSGRCRVTSVINFSPINASVWVNGNITEENNQDWYLFPVVSGTTYYIWWNDRKQGNAITTGDIAVSARYIGSSSWIFGGTNTTVDNGWTTAQSFTANQTGTVEIRVMPYNRNSSNVGTYSIVYNTNNIRPPFYTITFDINYGNGTIPVAQTVGSGSSITLPGGSGLTRIGYSFGGWNTDVIGRGTNYSAGSLYSPTANITLYARWNSNTTPSYLLSENTWSGTTFTSINQYMPYYFPVIAGTTYRIWWNDKKQGDDTQSGDVVVGARYTGSSSWIFGGTSTTVDSGWSTAQSFTANQNGIVEVEVRPYNNSSSSLGSFRITYSTNTTRP